MHIERIDYRELDYTEPSAKSSCEREYQEEQVYRQKLPSLKEAASAEPLENEERIARYLESAPGLGAMGKVVGDKLDPSVKVILFPSTNTDGRYIWPSELAYYVRTYHVRLPLDFIQHMASLKWQPPKEEELDWNAIHQHAT